MKIIYSLLMVVSLAWFPGTSWAADLKPWLPAGKFMGIRCGVEEKCLTVAKELGLNAVLANDNLMLEPQSPDYDHRIENLKRVSAMAKKLQLHFFVGWHAIGVSARTLAPEAEKEGSLCVSDPMLWERAFDDPMERVVNALSGPEYQLDGFLLDVENYARKSIRWDGKCDPAEGPGLKTVTQRAIATRMKLQRLHPGLLLGLYPLRAKEGRNVLWAWIKGLSQPDQPILLMVEYTYSGYQPELDLSQKAESYRRKAGNPVLLIPGFNFLKIPDPPAWKTHLYTFAKETGGYWLYPGNQLVQMTSEDAHEAVSAFNAVREANAEIRAFLANPQRTSPLDFRPQAPHETDTAHVRELVDLAGVVSPAAGTVENKKNKFTASSFRSGDVDLLIKAGPAAPLEFSIAGKGHFSVYDTQGHLLAFREVLPQGISFHLDVQAEAVYPVIFKTNDEKVGATITVGSRYWAFRGVSRGTSAGWTARFLQKPASGPFYFYVPQGTKFFRMFISDKTRGSLAVIHDPQGREVLRQAAGFEGNDQEHARQDVEIQVPSGQDGKVWSLSGTPGGGLPLVAIYGIPDLFNPDPRKLLTVGDAALKKERMNIDRRRTFRSPERTYIRVEAEELNGGPWRLSTAVPGTSGKGAMFARGFRSTLPLYGEVMIPKTGKWTVWVRALASEKKSKKRAVRVQLGETLLKRTHNIPQGVTDYRWENAGTVSLESGSVMLKVFPAKGGRPSIDVIALSDDLNWIPPETFETKHESSN